MAQSVLLRLSVLAISACLLLLLAACSSEPAEGGLSYGEVVDAVASPATSGELRVKIKRPDEQAVVDIRLRSDTIKIEYSNDTGLAVLRGELKESGKRKYALEGQGQVAEVKPGDDGFKLRSADGQLRWKVKLSESTIKISDNEEQRNPLVLKLKSEQEISILDGEEVEVGEVKFYPDRGKVKVKDSAGTELYESNSDVYSAMYGVLMLQQIPLTDRYIIMAELMARGR